MDLNLLILIREQPVRSTIYSQFCESSGSGHQPGFRAVTTRMQLGSLHLEPVSELYVQSLVADEMTILGRRDGRYILRTISSRTPIHQERC